MNSTKNWHPNYHKNYNPWILTFQKFLILLLANKIPKNNGGYFLWVHNLHKKNGQENNGQKHIMTSKPQACSITAILAVLTAIFLHNSLKLFLTGGNQAFNNVKGSEPNAAVGKKMKRMCNKRWGNDNSSRN